MNKLFQNTATAMPGRSAFNLNYSKLFTCDMGQLIPIMCDEVIPGDKFRIGNEVVVRMMPLVAPILHQIDITTHYFFVPYRLLWHDDDPVPGSWEDFITGGEKGTDASTLPLWDTPGSTAIGSLWDYLGFPTGFIPVGAEPIIFPLLAYNKIYNDFYRDEWLQDPVDLDDENIKIRAWDKDYLTSALLSQQKGTAPSLPITGLTSAVYDDDIVVNGSLHGSFDTGFNAPMYGDHIDGTPALWGPIVDGMHSTNYNAQIIPHITITDTALNDNVVDLSDAGAFFDAKDLRLLFQVQRWMERNARCGTRYTEFIRAHWGPVAPRDDRLQRVEYLGGTKAPIVISEILQTSETGTTPQGNMAGHGISVNREFAGSYFVQEYGLIMGIMSITPKPAYVQQVNRQWLRRSRFDFPSPEFVNLSEQGIFAAEVYSDNTRTNVQNMTVWGFQGKYDELRTKSSTVHALMKTDFDYWHLARYFTSMPGLNEDFIKCVPDKRIFAAESEPGFIVHFGNIIKAIRPIPIIGTPGRIDHN